VPWGLAAGGAEGVELVLRGLADELELAMRVTGSARFNLVDAELVRVG